VAEFTHTVPSGSRIVVVVSSGPMDEDFRSKLEADNITMPEVLGKSQGVALEELSDLGFKPRVIYDYNDDIVKGAVMDQHPQAGVLASPELESLLLVSSGPSINERVQVNLPDVVGMNEAEATAKLKDAGLSPQIVHYKSSEFPKGIVSAQIPDTASLVATPEVKSKVAWVIIGIIIVGLLALGYFINDRMNLTPPPPVETVVTQVTIPSLIGLSEDEAGIELQKAGLSVGQVSTADAADTPVGATPGTVITTTPAAGEEVLPGSPVSLILAGDAAAEAATLVTIPDVAGKNEDEVNALFEGLNLRVNLVRGPDLNVPENYAIAQSPAAGSEAVTDSVVVVVISTGTPPDPVLIDLVDVTGLPVSEAMTKLQEMGLVVTLPLGDEAASGTVVKQTPVAGANQVLVGSVVILEVETPTTAPATTTAP